MKNSKDTLREAQDMLLRIQTFFGVSRDIYYRDLDGNVYPLNMEPIQEMMEGINKY